MEWIIFALVAFFVITSLFIIICGILGVYQFKFVLNRMHAAALIDTLGLLFMNIALIIVNGFTLVSLKLFLVILIMWITSPISSHLISKLEYLTDENVKNECIIHKED